MNAFNENQLDAFNENRRKKLEAIIRSTVESYMLGRMICSCT
jgi:hypothetical protein